VTDLKAEARSISEALVIVRAEAAGERNDGNGNNGSEEKSRTRIAKTITIKKTGPARAGWFVAGRIVTKMLLSKLCTGRSSSSALP
jgi:hypothetical protein